MKKILCLSTILIVCSFLAACGGLKAENKNNYNTAKEVVETIDKYLDFKIDENELEERVERLHNRIENNSEASADMRILSARVFRAYILASDSVDDEKMLEIRNEIAKSIGVKEK